MPQGGTAITRALTGVESQDPCTEHVNAVISSTSPEFTLASPLMHFLLRQLLLLRKQLLRARHRAYFLMAQHLNTVVTIANTHTLIYSTIVHSVRYVLACAEQ
jgi:hypothetical protein